MTIDFVKCANTQEKLLLLLIERMEAVEEHVQQFNHIFLENPLSSLTPASSPSAVAEGRKLAKLVGETVPCPFTEPVESYAVTTNITHEVNVDLLRRQGFKVTRTFHSTGLPKSIFTVSWQRNHNQKSAVSVSNSGLSCPPTLEST